MTGKLTKDNALGAWYVDAALPLWAKRAWDSDRGGFHEVLGFDGHPILDRNRRVRVQARSIHTFAACYLNGVCDDGKALAEKGFDYFLDHACPDNGSRGCVHRLSPGGSIIDQQRDLYDQAFLLLACSSMWRLNADPRAIALANTTQDFLDTELTNQHGGWRENDAGNLPRRQNPHMHLFEAYLALYKATRSDRWLQLADTVFDLFSRRFFDSDRGVLREFFTDTWDHDSAKGDLIEPGHMMEWVWLLSLYAKTKGEALSPHAFTLFDCAIEISKAFDPLLMPNSVTLGAMTSDGSRRLWPQTEYLRALVVMHHEGRCDAKPKINHVIDILMATYFNETINGLWCDEFSGDGNRLAKDVPTSILYHLYECVAALSELS